MTEKLIIKRFAGIKELEIQVKKVNVLIGPQASGKSICAKLLFYFKSFVEQILSAVHNRDSQANLELKVIKNFEEYFPHNSWGDQLFCIRYEISNIFIEISRITESKNQLLLKYSDFFKIEFKELQDIVSLMNDTDLTLDPPSFDEYIHSFRDAAFQSRALEAHMRVALESISCPELSFNQFFIPAGRSFLSIFQANIFSLISNKIALDPFLKNFGSIYEYIRNQNLYAMKIGVENNLRDEINRLIKLSLRGKYVREKDEDFLTTDDGRQVNIINASSGQQEALPLTVMLASFLYPNRLDRGPAVYIEEPEAHLFPNAQRSIVELISTVFNGRESNLQFFITTHSPYVLTALNNLLQAGSIYRNSSQDIQNQLEKIVPRYKSLDIEEFSAYVLIDGYCHSIICPETNLIDAAVIDSVSDDLAIEFDKLLDLA